MERHRILVADDSPTVIDIIGAILEDAEFEVLIARDGEEALDIMYREKPDLMILDIAMPKMNGYTVCRRCKEDPETQHIPIIMLTAKDGESDRTWGVGVGADEYLVKWVEPEKLVETVISRLQRKTI
ncbi:response regulator [bacterium]|nr:response regulator [bacterium]